MVHCRTNLIAATASIGFTLFAVTLSTATVATRPGQTHVYHGVLRQALILELLALCCLAVPLFRGPVRWRVAAVVMASPALLVLSEIARRAPDVLAGG